MPLTERQKAELERRGYRVGPRGWVEVGDYIVSPDEPESQVPLLRMAEVAAILGLPIPGYRLVPERDAVLIAEVLGQLSYREVVTHGGFSEEQYRRVKALASALSPKEVE